VKHFFLVGSISYHVQSICCECTDLSSIYLCKSTYQARELNLKLVRNNSFLSTNHILYTDCTMLEHLDHHYMTKYMDWNSDLCNSQHGIQIRIRLVKSSGVTVILIGIHVDRFNAGDHRLSCRQVLSKIVPTSIWWFNTSSNQPCSHAAHVHHLVKLMIKTAGAKKTELLKNL